MLIETAYHVRREIEVLTKNHCTGIDPDDLCGACGIASWTLDAIYKKLGVTSEFVMGRFNKNSRFDDSRYGNHCWVQVGEYIVDLTATQFGISETVYIARISDTRYLPEHFGRSAKLRLAKWGDQSQSSYKFALREIVGKVCRQMTHDIKIQRLLTTNSTALNSNGINNNYPDSEGIVRCA